MNEEEPCKEIHEWLLTHMKYFDEQYEKHFEIHIKRSYGILINDLLDLVKGKVLVALNDLKVIEDFVEQIYQKYGNDFLNSKIEGLDKLNEVYERLGMERMY